MLSIWWNYIFQAVFHLMKNNHHSCHILSCFACSCIAEVVAYGKQSLWKRKVPSDFDATQDLDKEEKCLKPRVWNILYFKNFRSYHNKCFVNQNIQPGNVQIWWNLAIWSFLCKRKNWKRGRNIFPPNTHQISSCRVRISWKLCSKFEESGINYLYSPKLK